MVVDATTQRSSQPLDDAQNIFCPECNYNLHGTVGDRCPSCGWEIDTQELIDVATGRFHLHRVLTILASLTVGLLCLIPLGLMISQNRGHLNLHDAVAVLAVLVGVLGHFGAAVAAARSRNRWPMSNRFTGRVLVFVGTTAVLLSLFGAGRFLRPFDDPKLVRGVTVSNVVDFGLAALLYGLPGWSLLAITLTAFAWRRKRNVPEKVSPSQAESLNYRSPFYLEISQRYSRNQVTTGCSNERRPTTPAIEAAIQKSWTTSLSEAKSTNRLLFDGGLGRLVKATWTPQTLHLELAPTTFREFWGTNICNATLIIESDLPAFADPLGTSAIVTTADGRIILGRRGPRVAHYAGFVHCFGGLLEVSDKNANGLYDVFAAILRELNEETKLTAGALSNLIAIGLVRDRSILQPELLFEATTHLDHAGFSALFPKTVDAEHTDVVFVHDEPESIFHFLASTPMVTPTAQAALLLHGRQTWGESWYDQSCYLLYDEMPPKWPPIRASSSL
ncbi:MAG: NUDIX hydrolase [Planctomycetota bacterium]